MSASAFDSADKKFIRQTPPDDNRERLTCVDCGWINYENPRIIVTAIVKHESKIMLCRRAIRPRYGFWTFPGGFMEIGETPEDGAWREVFEEATADVRIHELMGVYAVPRIGQVHLVYLATLNRPEFAAGTESLEVEFFDQASPEFPGQDLAFPVNHWAVRDFLSLKGQAPAQPFTVRPDDLQQRMSRVDFHPDYPPPDTTD